MQSAIGCLIYAATATRPDLSAAVNALSQFMSDPSLDHWTRVKRVLRYVKGTIDYGIEFNAQESNKIEVIGYSDADWAVDIVSRKSTSGYVFKLAGAAVSWQSRRQRTVALTSTEAEYLALSSAAQETMWLRKLLSNLGYEQNEPTVLYEDNQGAIALAKNPTNHARTKHIDIRHHYIRQEVSAKNTEVAYCSNGDMVADVLTKGLSKEKFQTLRKM